MTVRQLEQNMTVGEFVEWLEFFRAEAKNDEIDLASATPDQLKAFF